ncbi:Serine/threonine-protein kinase PknD [compost metagenome]
MQKSHLALALGLTLLAGCANLPPLFHGAGLAVADGRAELRVQADVSKAAYTPQGLAPAYTLADVHHVTLSLHKLEGNAEIPVTGAGGSALVLSIPRANLAQPVTFSRLKPGTTYRVKAEAYNATGTLISAAGAYADVVVSRDDRPTMATLKVKLLGTRPFEGQATASGIAVTPGGLASSGSFDVAFLEEPVTTFVGGYHNGSFADGATSSARFYNPNGLLFDASGNLLVADTENNAIRKVTPDGVVTTWSSLSGYLDKPMGMTFDNAGNLIISNNRSTIIRVSSNGTVTQISDGGAGSGAASPTATSIGFPKGVVVDAAGNLCATEAFQTSRKVTPGGAISTFAGYRDGMYGGFVDGATSSAKFDNPYGLAIDASGNLYVADAGNSAIRKVTPAGVVTTVAGSYPTKASGFVDGAASSARFAGPQGLAIDASGNLFIADTGNNAIRKLDLQTGFVTTVAGGYFAGSLTDGSTSSARFSSPTGLAFDSAGYLYVADKNNHAIRKIVP